MHDRPVAHDSGIARLLDEAPVSRFQIGVIALCAMATFLDGYDVQALGVAIPRMAEEFHVAPASFAFAASGSLIGMAIGAVGLSPFADHIGRRPMLIGLMALIGLTTLGAAAAPNPLILTLWRVVSGLGLGAIVPIAIAMTSEYAPARRRAALVTLMIIWTAFGAFAAGFIAPVLDAAYGWRAIFLVGGALPLLMALILSACFPESWRFLAARGRNPAEVGRQVGLFAPGRDILVPASTPKTHVQQAGLVALFCVEFRYRTVLLWAIFWFNLFLNYSLISWLPTLLRAAGWSHGAAQRATGLLALGGIAGGLVIAWIADRGHTQAALSAAFLGTALLLCLFMAGPSIEFAWPVLLFLVGAGAFGAQLALGSIASNFYPAALRATGMGWSSGIGRIGAICGPLVLAGMMKAGFSTGPILAALAIPMLACVGGICLLPRALAIKTEGFGG